LTRRTRRLPDLLLWALLAAIIAVFLARTLVPAQNRLSHGFLAYYAAGDLIASGADGRQLYDLPAFRQRVRELSHGTVNDAYHGNTPALAVAWLPFATLPVESSRRLWIWLNGAFLLIAGALTVARLPRVSRLPAAVLLALLLTATGPAREHMFVGQMYALMLLLHTVGWQAYERRHEALAGAALAATMMLKVSGWPIVVLLLLRRRWAALGWAAGTALALFLFTLPWVGLDAWREAVFVQMPAWAAMPEGMLSAYQTVSSLWQHLFNGDAVFNPHPVADRPGLAIAAMTLTTLAACAALLLPRLSTQVQYGSALVLTVLLSPVAEQYHYMLVLLPFALLCLHGGFAGSRRFKLALLLTGLLLAAPFDYKAYLPGWWALLDYPRLAAGWMVFIGLLSVRQLRLGPVESGQAQAAR
jgi:hypothetical protein